MPAPDQLQSSPGYVIQIGSLVSPGGQQGAAGGGGIVEAPTDGLSYVRRSAAWAPMPTAGAGGLVCTVTVAGTYDSAQTITVDDTSKVYSGQTVYFQSVGHATIGSLTGTTFVITPLYFSADALKGTAIPINTKVYPADPIGLARKPDTDLVQRPGLLPGLNNDPTTFFNGQGAFTIPPIGVLEAPTDGKQYARQSSAWSVVISFPEAPSDGKMYARQSTLWVQVPPAGISDAPTDGQLYGRKSASWSVVTMPAPGIPEAPANSVYYARYNNSWQSVNAAFVIKSGDTWGGPMNNSAGSRLTSICNLPGDNTAYLKTSILIQAGSSGGFSGIGLLSDSYWGCALGAWQSGLYIATSANTFKQLTDTNGTLLVAAHLGYTPQANLGYTPINKAGDTLQSGAQAFIYEQDLGIAANSYAQAQVRFQRVTTNANARAGIGFLNNGQNGCYLYLGTDNKFHFVMNDGTDHVITSS